MLLEKQKKSRYFWHFVARHWDVVNLCFKKMIVFMFMCVHPAVKNAGHASFSEEEAVFNNSEAVIQSGRQPFYTQFIQER